MDIVNVPYLNSVQSRIMTAECGLDKLQKHKRIGFGLTWPKRKKKNQSFCENQQW